jgi:hypothetical protein
MMSEAGKPERTRLAVHIVRYALLFLFCASGSYYFFAMIQSASYSVPAQPMMSEIYKTRAMLYWPISILLFSVGGLLFICLRPRPRT